MFLWKIIEAQAAVNRCTATVDFLEEDLLPYPTTVNDERMYAHAIAEGMLGKANTSRLLPRPWVASEDFAFYAQRAAGAFFLIGRRRQRDHHGEGAPGALAVLHHG